MARNNIAPLVITLAVIASGAFQTPVRAAPNPIFQSKACEDITPATLPACDRLVASLEKLRHEATTLGLAKTMIYMFSVLNRNFAFERLGLCQRMLDDVDYVDEAFRRYNAFDARVNKKKPEPYQPYQKHFRRADVLQRCHNDYAEAVRILNPVVAASPHDAIAWVYRGNAHYLNGDADSALSDFEQALKLNPKSEGALIQRSKLYRDLGMYDRAMQDSDRAVTAQPNLAYPLAHRGDVWRSIGDMQRALADANAAVKLDEKNLDALLYRGRIFRYLGDADRAVADFDAALKAFPNLIIVLAERGLAWERKGNIVRARADFEAAINARILRGQDIRMSRSAQETARTRLAALNAASLPSIPALPLKWASPTSVPTPVSPAAVLTNPVVTSVAGHPGRRVALVIGNSAYQNVSKLLNPQKDAHSIAASLRNIGFETVTLAPDTTREKLTDALRNFANEAEKSDWAMVYYAGHGIEVNGMNYLVPVDAKLAVDRDVQFEAVPLERVMAAVEGARKLKLVVLDACRDNPFTPQMRKTASPDAVSISTAGGKVASRSIGRGLGRVEVSGGTLVVYAAKHGQVALDGEGSNSPFAIAMVQRIAAPGVEINKIFRLVRDDVMEATAGRQEPYTYGSLPGREDFFFVAPK
jgi:tetratricopeptide (TPR) repeat protein